jgi:hydroxymethylglutaryl-CoA lyase
MSLPARVRITEVGPRDGLQSEAVILSTEQKCRLIELLIAAGIREIEVAAFVHPRWMPTMADAEAVLAAVPRGLGARYSVLIPNLKGYQRAAPLRPDEIVVVCSASERHNQANLNRSTAESLAEFQQVVALAQHDQLPVRGAIATAFWCPYEGRISVSRVCDVAEAYAAMGVQEIALADTLGAADPRHVRELVLAVRQSTGLPVSLHLHNTAGLALACFVAALDIGVERFDTSIGGLGGCPYCPGAAGNVATEDVVFLLERLGIQTGIDQAKLLDAARYVQMLVGHPLHSYRLVTAGTIV